MKSCRLILVLLLCVLTPLRDVLATVTFNRLIATVAADGGTTTYVRDADGTATATIDPRGNTTDVSYDALDRPYVQINALGGRTTTLYDASGNVTSVTDPLGDTTQYRYDALNRVTETIDPLGNTSISVYNANGDLHWTIDTLGNYSYYVSVRPTRVLD